MARGETGSMLKYGCLSCIQLAEQSYSAFIKAFCIENMFFCPKAVVSDNIYDIFGLFEKFS